MGNGFKAIIFVGNRKLTEPYARASYTAPVYFPSNRNRNSGFNGTDVKEPVIFMQTIIGNRVMT